MTNWGKGGGLFFESWSHVCVESLLKPPLYTQLSQPTRRLYIQSIDYIIESFMYLEILNS